MPEYDLLLGLLP